jgi:uncharacterized protein YkwD
MKIPAALILLVAAAFPILSQDKASFASAILARHNLYRAAHGAAALTWSAVLEKQAADWAKRLAREEKLYHRQPNRYGENIYWISGGSLDAAAAVDAWYGEIEAYDFAKGGFSAETGHFTQVVWASTTELGCGWARSRSGAIFVVCNYNPPGNVLGRFPANVKEVQKR